MQRVATQIGEYLEVVVAANNVVRLPKAVQVLAHELEARRSASIQLLGLCAVLGLTNVAKRHLDDRVQGAMVRKLFGHTHHRWAHHRWGNICRCCRVMCRVI